MLAAVPLAGYLILHLLGQVLAVLGSGLQRGFQRLLEDSMVLSALEMGLIYLPLCAHAGLGLWLVARGEGGPASTAPGKRAGTLGWQHWLLRLSALPLLLFLAFHIWQFEGRLWLGELSRSDFVPELGAGLSSTAFGGVPLVALGYLLGVAAAVLHAAYGLYQACSDFDWLTPRGRERLGRACVLGGLMLFAVGAWIVVQLATGSVS